MLELNPEVARLLNEQITAEAEASQIYLQMCLWCEERGLEGAASFFRRHVSEEMAHRDKLVDYMIECDAPVALEAIPAPPNDYSNLVDIVKAAYEHEKKVTVQIHELAKIALDESDFSTFNMLQWFIAEQREEMMLFRGVLDYVRLSGFTGDSGDEMVNMNEYLRRMAAEHE